VSPVEALELVVDLLLPVRFDLRREKDKRVYAALLAARVTLTPDLALHQRLGEIRGELGL
jgi:hypothetical protein